MFSTTVINLYLRRIVPDNVIEQHPSIHDLVFELIGGACSSWTKKNQLPIVVLGVKYALLHKISIYNWCPSSHKYRLSIALTKLLYQIGTWAQFN